MASALSLIEIGIEIGLIESSLRRQRVFRDRLNPLDAYSDFEFSRIPAKGFLVAQLVLTQLLQLPN